MIWQVQFFLPRVAGFPRLRSHKTWTFGFLVFFITSQKCIIVGGKSWSKTYRGGGGAPGRGGALGDEAAPEAGAAPENWGVRQQPLPTPCPLPWDRSCPQKRRFFKWPVDDSAADVYTRRWYYCDHSRKLFCAVLTGVAGNWSWYNVIFPRHKIIRKPCLTRYEWSDFSLQSW